MTAQKDKLQRELATVRDTVESVGVAIVLAFVLRAFIIEAFVIPTGSMAPRLMGEHWDLVCPACGYEYSFGWPGEPTAPREAGTFLSPRRGQRPSPGDARCPSCGRPHGHDGQYVNGGDRVLVMKYLYHFSEPKPWDVIVFKNPQNNRENYIKRLIGLPGEQVEIVHGDVFYRTGDQEPWRIRRKPDSAQEEMWQVVFDNDYRPEQDWLDEGVTPRWEPAIANDPAWDLQGEQGRAFAFKGAAQPSFLTLSAGREWFLPRYGYNAQPDLRRYAPSAGVVDAVDVCTDLKLSLVFVPLATDSAVSLMLSSFDSEFRADISAGGSAELWRRCPRYTGGQWQRWGSAALKPLKPGQGYQLALTHADFRVKFWVDGVARLTSSDEKYHPDRDELAARLAQAQRVPVPRPQVRLAASGGQCELRHIRLMRDAYYTCPNVQSPPAGPLGDLARTLDLSERQRGWGTTGNPIALTKYSDQSPAWRDFDEFWALGDNSPSSLDGRSWTSAAPSLALRPADVPEYKLGTVPRSNIIGKALFVYWPAGFRPPGLPSLPVLPNVGEMRFIR